MGKMPAILPLPTVPDLFEEGNPAAPATSAVPAEANVTHAATPNVTLAERNVTLTSGPNVTPGRIVLDPPDPPWQDPRPDLIGDRHRWWVLLQAAYRLDGESNNSLFGVLVGLRGCGARLEIAGPPNWHLGPEGPLPNWRLVKGEEMTEAEYADYRERYLVPHRAALTRLLAAPSTIAHAPLAPGEPPLTGRGAAQPAEQLPRKVAPAPAEPAQPALLAEVEAAGSRWPGGDW